MREVNDNNILEAQYGFHFLGEAATTTILVKDIQKILSLQSIEQVIATFDEWATSRDSIATFLGDRRFVILTNH